MHKKYVIAIAAIILPVAPANAAPCKDAKGKFIKCPPAAAVTHAPAATATHVAISHPATAHPAAATTRKAPCRDAKTGRFKKC